jgi:hypothetical protein
MGDYPDIKVAAQHEDWRGCARILFMELFRRSNEEQYEIAWEATCEYLPIWQSKHPNLGTVPEWLKFHQIDNRREPPLFPEDDDAADAEFENALLELHRGAARKERRGGTAHFAGAVRSSVLARQINQWINDFPEQYRSWKEGRAVSGKTFLDDAKATKVAVSAWMQVGDLLNKMRTVRSGLPRIEFTDPSEETRAYGDWEQTLL